MSGIRCLVFSKDRAMQLDAFLRSAKRFAPYERIDVVWRESGGHAGSYLQVRREHPDVGWWWHAGGPDFERNVRGFLRAERVVFHTDDDVFFRRAWLPPEYWQAVSSLRLGANTTYCHPLDRSQSLPAEPLETQLLWRWRDADGDFGYPLSLNGTVYRSADLLPLLDFHFANPTELEAGLAVRAGRFEPEWMTAALHSSVVSLPHNVVSSSSGNPRGANPDWQPDALCAAFLDGWRIDLGAMDFTQVVGAHQEIPLRFHRP